MKGGYFRFENIVLYYTSWVEWRYDMSDCISDGVNVVLFYIFNVLRDFSKNKNIDFSIDIVL